jgi:hypothetical protein
MLKKTSTTVLIVLICSAIAFGFQLPSDWVSFNSPEGRFSIGAPTKPQENVKDIDSDVGKLQLHSFASSSAIAYFMVSYGDYPNEPAADRRELVLDGVRDGVIKGLEGELISETKISINGYPGRQLLARKTIEGSETTFNWRIYLVGPRVYQVAVATKKSDSATPEITKFLNSFRLTN